LSLKSYFGFEINVERLKPTFSERLFSKKINPTFYGVAKKVEKYGGLVVGVEQLRRVVFTCS